MIIIFVYNDNDFHLNNMELALDYRIYKAYQIQKRIGKGVYGQVFKAIQKLTGKPYAIKKILDAFQNLTDAKRTYRQLAYLLQLSHPCIIKLQKIIIGQQENGSQSVRYKNVYAVFQLMEMDLARILQVCKLQSVQRKYIALQILAGLQYLHSSDLIHRDIKPSNILLNTNCDTKICDFGLVRLASQFKSSEKTSEQVFTEYVASKWYRAPQIILNGNQFSTYAIDIWSTGCVLAQMCLGVPLFIGNHNMQQLQRIFSVIGMPLQSEIQQTNTQQGKYLLKNLQRFKRVSFNQILSHHASCEQIDLISKMLVFNPKKRISAKEALNHPYFDDLRQQIKKFKSFPVQIVDHSLKLKQFSLQVYKQLIEGLCISTKRGLSSKSKQSNRMCQLQTKNMYKSQKSNEALQEKSTRQSHEGLLRKYQPKITKPKDNSGRVKQKSKDIIKCRDRQLSNHDSSRVVTRIQSKVTVKMRSKSKQSMNSIHNKQSSGSTNKSKTKITGNKSQHKIKPFKIDSNFSRQEPQIKIQKKKKKQ